MKQQKKINLYTPSPSNLKRDRYSFMSTQDASSKRLSQSQTLKFSRYSHQIPEPFKIQTIHQQPQKQNFSLLNQRLQAKSRKLPSPKKQFSNIIRDKVIQYLEYDNQLSILRERQGDYNTYLSVNLPNITYGYQSIPDQVTKTYHEQINKNGGEINFSKGYLPGIGYLYYAINNILFFQSIIQNINFKKPNSPSKLILQHPIIKVLEGKINTQVINENIKDKILLVCYPFQIKFFSYEFRNKQLIVQDISLKFDISKQVLDQIIISDKGNIIYLDQNGKINKLIDREEKYFYFYNNGKYKLDNYKYDPSILTQIFENHKNQTLVDHLKYFSKTLITKFRTFIVSKIQNKCLTIDNRRNLIFCLIKKGNSQQQIYVYKQDKQIMHLINTITEFQLYKILISVGVVLYQHNFNIFKLSPVTATYFPESNLEVILQNGTRIFLYVNTHYFKHVKTLYTPCFQFIRQDENLASQRKFKIDAYHNSIIHLKQVHSERQRCLMVIQTQQQLSSYLIYKTQGKQPAQIGKIKWKTLQMKHPQQIFLHSVSQDLLCEQAQKNLLRLNTKYAKFPIINWMELNELAQQVYLGPKNYILNVEDGIQFMVRLRPIDIVFNFVKGLSLEECKIQMDNLSKTWKKVELCCMLIQMLCHKQMKFYSTNLLQLSLLKVYNKNNEKFQYQANSEIKIEKISQKQFNNQMTLKIIELVNYLGQSSQSLLDKQQNYYQLYEGLNKSVNKNQLNSRQEAIILYTTRILRIIWHIHIDHLNSQNLYYITQRLIEVKEFMNDHMDIFSQRKASSSTNKLSESISSIEMYIEFKGYIDHCLQLIQLIKMVYKLPKITFQEGLNKDNRFFEEYLFKELIKYKENVEKKWKIIFPNYLNDRFIKICGLFYQIQSINTSKQILQILKQFGELPKYFLDYLERFKNISNSLYLKLEKVIPENNQLKNQLINGKIQQKYLAALQLVNTSSTVDQKILYIDRTIQYLKEIIDLKKFDRQENHRLQLQLDIHLTRLKLLKLQKLIIQLLKQLKDNSQKVSILIKQANQTQLSKQKIKDIILSFQKIEAEVIYFLNFPEKQFFFDVTFKQIIEKYKNNWPYEFQQILKYISHYVNFKIIPINIVVQQIQQFNFGLKKNYDYLQNLLKVGKQQKLYDKGSPFWLAQTLLSFGLSDKQIYEIYEKKLQESLDECRIEITQRNINFLYWWWLGLYKFVRILKNSILTQRFSGSFKKYSQQLRTKNIMKQSIAKFLQAWVSSLDS